MNRQIFNIGTLNIFTDASVKQLGNGKYVSCAGCVCVTTKENGSTEVIDERYFVLNDSTNNRGELYGICQAVMIALEYRQYFNTINILSDSQFSIFGLREWIFKWKSNMVNERYVNASGKDVANQDLFKLIINTIVSNNLYINFYHQKGHVNNNKGFQKAKRVFYQSNKIDLDIQEVNGICYYNDLVDINTGYKLDEIARDIEMPLIYSGNFDVKKYRKLIKR